MRSGLSEWICHILLARVRLFIDQSGRRLVHITGSVVGTWWDDLSESASVELFVLAHALVLLRVSLVRPLFALELRVVKAIRFEHDDLIV